MQQELLASAPRPGLLPVYNSVPPIVGDSAPAGKMNSSVVAMSANKITMEVSPSTQKDLTETAMIASSIPSGQTNDKMNDMHGNVAITDNILIAEGAGATVSDTTAPPGFPHPFI